MSNGSSELTFRDSINFTIIGTIQVLMDGNPLSSLNELECVDSMIWANVWHQDIIVVIDPETGLVVNEINVTGLLTAEQTADSDVLNGIAVSDDDAIWLTGKNWPSMFNVTLYDVHNQTNDSPDVIEPENDDGWSGVILSAAVALCLLLLFYTVINRVRAAMKLKDVEPAQRNEGVDYEPR